MSVKTLAKFFYFITTLVVSAGIFLVYLSFSRVSASESVSFPKMLEGKASRPVVYRQLIPILARVGARLVPGWLVETFQYAPFSLGSTFHSFSQGQYPKEAIVALTLMFFSLIGFIFAEKDLLKHLGYSGNEQLVLPVTIAVQILPLTIHFGYVYDLPQVFLFSLCLLFLYRCKWHVYLPLLAIAILNKETSFFLIVIFGLYFFRRLRLRTYLLLLAAQAGIFFVIRAAITYMYRNNPGSSMPWTVQFHMDQYTNQPLTFLFTFLFFGVIVLLAAKGWKNKPLFLRYSFSTFFITTFLFFTSGSPMEFRVFLDVLPIFGILMFPSSQLQLPDPPAQKAVR